MIRLFLAQAQKLLPEIRSAGERGDGKALERFAHEAGCGSSKESAVNAATARHLSDSPTS